MAIGNNQDSTRTSGDCVVVVHGFSGKRIWMMPLCRRLRGAGFRVINWGYVSFWGSIPAHAKRLHEFLSEELKHEPRFHIVAHSMGAIVVRAALAGSPVANLSRILFVAPPHTGTPVARIASTLCLNRIHFFRDLSDAPTSLVNSLPALQGVETASIAGRFDLLVPERNTHSPDSDHHVSLNATHNSLLFSRTTARLASRFLANGRLTY